MYKKLMTLLSLFILLPTLVSAQTGRFGRWYELLNIPQEYSEMPELLYFVFLPFVSVFAVIFGLLSQIFGRTFPKKVNVILAFVFALSLLYTGPLMALVGVLFQVGSIFGVIVFFIMFVLLTLLLLYRRVGESVVDAKKIHQQYKDIAKQTEKLAKNLEKIGNNLKDIEEKINKKRKDLAAIAQALRVVRGKTPGELRHEIWDPIRREVKRLTHAEPAHEPNAQGLLEVERSRLNVEIADLETKRAKLLKEKEKIEDVLRS